MGSSIGIRGRGNDERDRGSCDTPTINLAGQLRRASELYNAHASIINVSVLAPQRRLAEDGQEGRRRRRRVYYHYATCLGDV